MPSLSIVTTVYDRVECLETCIRSVANLNYRDLEHIVVADGPPADVRRALEHVVSGAADPRVSFHCLPARANDFGISPAASGLKKAHGKFLAFLDDDNAYLAEHFDALVSWLESSPDLGFVYSACLYRGDRVLAPTVPAEGDIDLGQILFRRELFRTHLNDELRYSGYAWDWQLLRDLMARGVRYRLVDQATFLFPAERVRPFEAEARLVQARARIRDLDAAAQRAREETEALRRELAAQRAEVAVLRGDREALQAQNAALVAESAALQARNAALVAESAALQAQKTALQAQNAALASDLAALRSDLSASGAALAALRREREALHGTIAALETSVGQARREAEALRASLTWRLTAPLRKLLDRLV